MRRPLGNLPAEVTSFVGRRREFATAKRLLSTSRLLTLVGTGGVGKTRLARRVAADAQRAFADGVWMVELASVQQGELIAQTISSVLGVRDQSPDPVARLAGHLRDKKLLLVLDNCEHVLAPSAELISQLLAVAPQVRVLVTSRQVLGIAGEQLLPVPPLSVRAIDEPGVAEQAEAELLFAERAAAVVPDFAVSDQNRHLVSALCRRLDGIPLALELAAVRLRAMSLTEIVDRVNDALGFLVVGNRTAPPRQQTLEAAVGWSFDLCSEPERQLWQDLSVFSGGFTLDAVAAVCGRELTRGDVVDLLTALVDKSIVGRPTQQRGVYRYTMLEVLRQYGAGKLADAGRERALRRQHRDYFGQLAARGMTDYASSEDVAWFRTVGLELANLRGALEFSLTQRGEAKAALNIVAGLRPYWSHTGYNREGFRWLRRVLNLEPDATPERARALCAAALLAVILSDVETAQSLSNEGSKLAGELGDSSAAAALMVVDAMRAYLCGDLLGALDLAYHAAERGEGVGDPLITNEALLGAALASFELNDRRAPELAARFLAATEGSGAHLLSAVARCINGLICLRDHDEDEARQHLNGAIAQFAEFDRPVFAAMGLEALASLAAVTGEYDRAATLMGSAHLIWHNNQTPMARQISRRATEEASTRARTALGTDAFAAAFVRGTALGYDEALRYAAGQTEPDDVRALTTSEHRATTALTRRELQIARLIAGGLSNKDIAFQLVISKRTVESHVEHILNKLGFHSRTQIAAWVGGQG